VLRGFQPILGAEAVLIVDASLGEFISRRKVKAIRQRFIAFWTPHGRRHEITRLKFCHVLSNSFDLSNRFVTENQVRFPWRCSWLT
jgi:hypothetical protein